MSTYVNEIDRIVTQVRAGRCVYEAVAASRYVNQPRLFVECMNETMYPDECSFHMDLHADGHLSLSPAVCFFALVCDVREALDSLTPVAELRLP